MGNAESAAADGLAQAGGVRRAGASRAKKGTKGGAKSAPQLPPQESRLIVEKYIDGVDMKQLQSMVSDLKELKAVLEERKVGSVDASAYKGEELEEEEKLSALGKMSKKMMRMVTNEAPVGEDAKNKLPLFVLSFYWFLGKALLLAALVYFTYTTYTTDQMAKNLSLDSSSQASGVPSSNYRLCLSVPNAITGSWVMDTSGYWSGMTDYIAGHGIYSFSFSSFQRTNEEYSAFVRKVKSVISSIAKTASTSPIWINLAYVSSWVYPITDGSFTHSVSIPGDPAYIFNRFYKTATVATQSVKCYAVPDISLDRASGNFVVQWTYGKFTIYQSGQCTNITQAGEGFLGGSGTASSPGNPACTTSAQSIGCCPPTSDKNDGGGNCVVPPSDAGYNANYDSKHFTFRYNIRSLMTAYAINQGILPLTSLTTVTADVEQSYRGCYALYGTSPTSCDTAVTMKNKTCGNSFVGLAYNATSKKCSIKIKSTRYNIRSYMDPRFTGMEPVYCLVDKSIDDTANATAAVCTIRLGSAYVYPFVNHMGASASASDNYNWGLGCHCSKPSFPSSLSSYYDDGTCYTASNNLYPGQTYSYCNYFDLMHGFIIFKGQNYDYHLYNAGYMATQLGYTHEQINNMAYFPAFAALRLGGNAGAQSLARTATNAKSSNDLSSKVLTGASGTQGYSFCTFTTGVSDSVGVTSSSCTVFAMQTVDDLDKRVNNEGVNLPLLSCNDFVSVPDASWDDGNGGGTVNVPPTSLVQQYYQCYNTVFSSLQVAFGSASGTASAIAPIVLMLIVSLTVNNFLPKPKVLSQVDALTQKQKEEQQQLMQQQQQQLMQQQQQQQQQLQQQAQEVNMEGTIPSPSPRPGLFNRLFRRKASADVQAQVQEVSIVMTGENVDQDQDVEEEEYEYEEVDEEVEEEVEEIDSDAQGEAKRGDQRHTAPLPPGWEQFVDDATGEFYYVHAGRTLTQWDRPLV